jgi:hypothetical protein
MDWSFNELERHLNRFSDFGFIHSTKLRDLLMNLDALPPRSLVDRILQIVDVSDDHLVPTQSVTDYLRNI